jgi:hypothetical protein
MKQYFIEEADGSFWCELNQPKKEQELYDCIKELT